MSHKNLFRAIKFFACMIAFMMPMFGYAATFTMTPASGSYQVGKTFSVAVTTNSGSQSLNAISGTLSYSKDLLDIVSVSKAGSVVNLWVKEPTFANGSGTANFEGIILNPGYTGSAGRIVSYTFKAKKAGTATIKVSGGSILANDGNGTEIYKGANSASFTITPADEKPIIVPEKKPELVTPVVVPVPVAGYAYLDIHEIPRDNPTDPIARFSVTLTGSKDLAQKYDMRIDQGKPFVWQDGGDGIFTAPALGAGSHTLLIKTASNGRLLTGYVDFEITELAAPVVNYYTKLASIGDPVIVYGTTTAGNQVLVSFRNRGVEVYSEQVTVKTDGTFMFVGTDKLNRGTYDIDVSAIDASGAKSQSIDSMKLMVKSKYYIKIGNIVIDGYLVLVGLAIAAIVTFLFAAAASFRRK